MSLLSLTHCRYYHGLYDTAVNINYTYHNESVIDSDSVQFYLGKVAEGLAVSLYKYMTEKDYENPLNSSLSAQLVS